MAMHILAIPATSCPSEGVFNKTKRIFAPHRSVRLCLVYMQKLSYVSKIGTVSLVL